MGEGQKAIKRYQGSLRDTIQAYEDESRSRQQITEAVGIAERKAGALSGEVEESRALLDSADRGKRQIHAESRAKRALDTQLGELEVRLTDAEANAMKGGK